MYYLLSLALARGAISFDISRRRCRFGLSGSLAIARTPLAWTLGSIPATSGGRGHRLGTAVSTCRTASFRRGAAEYTVWRSAQDSAARVFRPLLFLEFPQPGVDLVLVLGFQMPKVEGVPALYRISDGNLGVSTVFRCRSQPGGGVTVRRQGWCVGGWREQRPFFRGGRRNRASRSLAGRLSWWCRCVRLY